MKIVYIMISRLWDFLENGMKMDFFERAVLSKNE